MSKHASEFKKFSNTIYLLVIVINDTIRLYISLDHVDFITEDFCLKRLYIAVIGSACHADITLTNTSVYACSCALKPCMCIPY